MSRPGGGRRAGLWRKVKGLAATGCRMSRPVVVGELDFDGKSGTGGPTREVNMWKVNKSESLISNRWLSVKKEEVKLPNGQIIEDFYTVTLADAAAIVALDTEGNIILKKEYKHATGEELIEVPAGMFEPGEADGLVVAKRELLEETGYVSENWQYFGDTVESSSKLTNRMHIYLATDCVKVAGQNLDTTEELEVVVMPFEEAIEMVMKNEIKCNSSAHGILRAARMLGK